MDCSALLNPSSFVSFINYVNISKGIENKLIYKETTTEKRQLLRLTL